MSIGKALMMIGVGMALGNLVVGALREWSDEALSMALLLLMFSLFCLFTVGVDEKVKKAKNDDPPFIR